MYAIYTFHNNRKVRLFLWDDILEGKNFRTSTEGQVMQNDGKYNNRDISFPIKQDKEGKFFFELGTEKKYIDDFDYMTVNELITRMKISDEKRPVTQEEIWATFMKDTENVGMLLKVSPLDRFLLSFGIGLYSSNADKDPVMLCVPTEKKHKKSNWSYKITFEVADEQLRDSYASKDFYFSDLVSLLYVEGNKHDSYNYICELVNKNEYLIDSLNKDNDSLPKSKVKTLLFSKKRND